MDQESRGTKRVLAAESTSGPAVASGAGGSQHGSALSHGIENKMKQSCASSGESARRSKRARKPAASDYGIGMDAEEQLQLRLALEKSLVQTVCVRYTGNVNTLFTPTVSAEC